MTLRVGPMIRVIASMVLLIAACTDPQQPTGPGIDVTWTGFDVPNTPDTYVEKDYGQEPDYFVVPETDVVSCTPFSTACIGPTQLTQCNGSGDDWVEAPCPNATGCVDGECVAQTCTPGQSTGVCVGPTSYERCNLSGTGLEVEDCLPGQKCINGICATSLCPPGLRICSGLTAVQQCDAAGDNWVDVETCPTGGVCDNGFCLNPCQVNVKAGSYLGCEYYAMDLDNIEESKNAPVGVVISVPTDKAATDVTISDALGPLSPAQLGVGSTTVQPGSSQIFVLPAGYDVDGTIRTTNTFRIETTSPVAVHQFNPLNGDGVYTNDASLLLPSNVTGKDYVVLSWAQRNSGVSTPLRGFVTVIATETGATEFSITPTADIQSGPGVEAGISTGETVIFTLFKGQAINFETTGNEGADLTGTIISADRKLSVIGGHECANVPLGTSACDHLEQQLYPIETWGNEYIADRFHPRSAAQVDIYRVVAGDNDVTVTTTPPVPGYEQFLLQRGQWIQFASGQSFAVNADGPILVGHYMTGANYPGAAEVAACEFSDVGKPEPIGDPAFTLGIPTNRFLKEYSVLTPSGYMDPTNPVYSGVSGVSSQNYLNVIIPQGAQVFMDGAPLNATFTAVPGTPYSVGTVTVTPGIHSLESEVAFGLTAYGYDCNVSYAYPGGLRLQASDN